MCDRACRMGFRMVFLAQKVEHQCTKLKVAGSSVAEVHFFLLPQNEWLYFLWDTYERL